MIKNNIIKTKREKFDKKLAVLEDSKNEIQNRVDIENQKLSTIQQKIRDVEKYGELNPFDFNDIDQDDDEINLNEFLDLAENNKSKFYRIPIFDLILDSQRGKYPFILNGEFIINDGEPFQINRFDKDSEQLTISIEKMIDKYDKTLKVLFSGYMMKYTMVFNQIKRSNCGKGCDAFNNILEYKGQLCYIPTGNACLRKCLDYFYKRDFSNEYKEFILDSDRCKNSKTSAKIQPIFRKYNIKQGVYNKKTTINST